MTPMLILMIPYFAAFAWIAFELCGMLARRAPRTPVLPLWCWVGAIVAAYLVQLAALRYAATNLVEPVPWRQAMPLPVVFLGIKNADAVSAICLASAAVQSYALLALYRARVPRALVAGGCALLLAISFGAPVLASFDPYGYVHNALLGILAYSPPATPFPGEFHVIDLWFGRPTATLYGPLWLAIVRAVTEWTPTLLGKIFALRAFNLALYLALLALLRALALPPRFVAAAALNSGLMFEFVANAHNDIIAVDLLLGAAVMMRRWPLPAFGAIVVAGLVKLPYLVLGLPVVSAVRPAWKRYAGCAAAIAAALALSWFGGGVPYLHALTRYSLKSHVENEWHVVPVLLAFLAIAAAVAGRRRLIGALWLIPSIGAFGMPIVFPWYLAWGFPYALARHRILGFLLVAFPLASALIMPELMRPWTVLVALPLAVALAVRPRA